MRKKNDLTLYNHFAETWWDPNKHFNALRHLNKPRFSFFDQYLSNWADLKVLDVGCGGGFTAEFVASRGAHVFGIDQSEKLIEVAKQHAAMSGYDIGYQAGSAESLPYEDNSLDVVICVDVLEHVADVSKTVSEIARVLKPGGTFFFDTINRTLKSRMVMIWLLENILRQIPKGVHDWNKFIKPAELLPVLGKHGFRNVEIKGISIRGRDKTTGAFKAQVTDDLSVMYVGKGIKSA